MFGYIRPAKEELKLKEFTIYKSIYCGLCKEIKNKYGNIPRLALTYDMTFFALLGISLSQDQEIIKMESCFLNPLKKRAVLTEDEFLELAAALSILLAQVKIADDLKDFARPGKKAGQTIKSIAFRTYYKKAKQGYGIYEKIILESIKKINEIENHNQIDFNHLPVYNQASDEFGNLLGKVFNEAFKGIFKLEKNESLLQDGMEMFGFYLGKWIYIIDAVDDYERDVRKNEFNAFLPLDENDMKAAGEEILIMCEDRMDKIAALLPYKRNGSIISNIILQGMPEVRRKVFEGQKLGRV